VDLRGPLGGRECERGDRTHRRDHRPLPIRGCATGDAAPRILNTVSDGHSTKPWTHVNLSPCSPPTLRLPARLL